MNSGAAERDFKDVLDHLGVAYFSLSSPHFKPFWVAFLCPVSQTRFSRPYSNRPQKEHRHEQAVLRPSALTSL